MSYWVDGLSKLGLEAVNNKADFETGVAGEDAVAVDLLEFKRPVGDQDDLLEEVADLGGWELLFEIVESSLGEVGWDVEEGVADQEVGGSLLDENLEHLLAVANLGGVTVVVDEVGKESLEGRGHFDFSKIVISGDVLLSY